MSCRIARTHRGRTDPAGLLRFVAVRLLRDQRGFTLTELITASVIFMVVVAPMGALLTGSLALQRANRQKALADEAASSAIESVRALPYDSVGTTDGNPPGSIEPTREISEPGLDATLETQVSYVSDRVPTAFETEADYKKVVVTVQQRNGNQRMLSQQTTFVSAATAPPYGGVNYTIIKAQVVDDVLNTPLPGATVSISGGPSASPNPRRDVTNGDGKVTFPALTANPTSGPHAYYDVTSTLAGYETLSDDAPPRSAAHVQLAPGQTFSTTLRMYKPATISVFLRDASGRPYTGAATVTVGSSRGGQTFAWNNGMPPITSINGEPVVPGLRYSVSAYAPAGTWASAASAVVPQGYPTTMTSSFGIDLSSGVFTTKTLTVTVETGGAAVANARVEISGGPASTYLAATTDGTGQATLTVPNGPTPYTVDAAGSAGEGSGSTTVIVNGADGTATVGLS